MKHVFSICLLGWLSVTAIYAQKRIYVPLDETYESYINIPRSGAKGSPLQGNITVKNVNTGKELLKLEVEGIDYEDYASIPEDTLSVDEQDLIMMDDYNFDGINDIAITNGQLNSDDTYQYQVYLGTKDGNLVFNPDFTDVMSQGGKLTLDIKNKELRFEYEDDETSGVIVDIFKVKGNKPVLIGEK